MEYMELITKRESCRKYADRAVEQEKIERCIEAARLAPSACNGQPWRYFVVRTPEKLNEVRPMMQGGGMNAFLDGCPVLVIVAETGGCIAERLGGTVSRVDFRPFDIGLSISQFCCEATEQGLSTCILGWMNREKMKKLLPLDAGESPVMAIALGYAATEDIRVKKRKTTEQIVTYL